MSSLINSNRKEDIKPKHKATLSDLDLTPKQEDKKENNEENKQLNTTMTIGLHDRNTMQALVVLGEAKTLKDVFSLVINSYYEKLPQDKRNMVDMLNKTFKNK